MRARRNSSSDRLAVIMLAAVCLLFLVLISGIGCLLYTFLMPANLGDRYTEPRAYICGYGSKAVFVNDALTGESLGTIALSNDPLGVAVSHDGNLVYISDGSSVAVADARTNEVIGTVATRYPATGYLVISPDDSCLYVVCEHGMSVIKLEDKGGKEIAFIDGVTAMGIGVSPDGRYVFTTDWGNCRLQIINTITRCIEKTIDLVPEGYSQRTINWEGIPVKAAGQAVGLAVSPDGSHVIVGIWAGSFAPVVDLQGMRLEKAVNFNGRSFQCAAYSPDGSRAYLSWYDNDRIMVINGTSYELISSFGVADSPKNLAISPDGKYLYVAHEQANVEIFRLPDGVRFRTLDVPASKSGMNIAFNPAAV